MVTHQRTDSILRKFDLKLRGPGDLMGTQQSGMLNLKIADIVKINDILKTARFLCLNRFWKMIQALQRRKISAYRTT